MIWPPRDFNAATLSIVAGCDHIFPFIAGAIKIGARVASAIAASGWLANPCASSAMMLAVAGAIKRRLARSAKSMWPGRQLSFSSKKLVITGFLESVCKVSGEMNSVASCVITTKTSWPCLTKRLASSADLYAAIDPVTPSTTDFLPGGMSTTFPKLLRFTLCLEFFSIAAISIILHQSPAQERLRRHDVADLFEIFFD